MAGCQALPDVGMTLILSNYFLVFFLSASYLTSSAAINRKSRVYYHLFVDTIMVTYIVSLCVHVTPTEVLTWLGTVVSTSTFIILIIRCHCDRLNVVMTRYHNAFLSSSHKVTKSQNIIKMEQCHDTIMS